MNKNRLKALLHKQETKQVKLPTIISSNDIIETTQLYNTSKSELNLGIDSSVISSNDIIETAQLYNTSESELNLEADSSVISSNDIIETTQLYNTLGSELNLGIDSSDIFLNDNIDDSNILSEQDFQNILDNELNIITPFSEVFSNDINDISVNKLDISIALLLSKQYNFKNEEINELLKLNICNKNFYDEYITTIEEFSYLVTEIITLFGTTNIVSNIDEDKYLFRSFSTYLNIDQKQLREDSVNYILMKWIQFKDFAIHLDSLEPYKSSDEYKSSMLADDSPGDYLTVFALCELYQINAIVIITEGIQLSNPIKINAGSSKTILIKC